MGHYTLNEQNIDVAEVVRAATGMLAVRAIKGQVSVSCGEFAGIHLHVDRLAVKQIVLNLLTNAVKFTLPGGQVRISGSSAASGGFVLTIADTGIGIAEAALPHVCAPFYQADASSSRAYGGTGLGLAICSKLVKLHGGGLEIESQQGQGTTVRVRFPKERVVSRALVGRELT